MPTILTHAAVGLALAAFARPAGSRRSVATTTPDGAVAAARTDARWWWLAALLPVVPDGDTPIFGAHGGVCAHRGVTHSLLFAALLAAVALCAFYRRELSLARGRAAAIGVFLFVVTVSHGLLDAATDGGAGILLLWPFSPARVFWSARPIAVAPLSIAGFFTERGWTVFVSELRWVWAPALAVVLVGEAVRRLRPSARP